MAETTYLEAIRQAMLEEMDRDPAVVLIGEDVGVYGGAFKTSEGLLARFGWERVIDTPISESAIVGAAIGMSYAGLRPIAEMQFIDFIACAFEMITNFAAKSHYRWGAPVPMVLRGPSGGGVHGGPFHSANPEMYFVHTPGLKVVCPATARDAKGLLKSAIRDNNPVLFFEHKFLYRRVKEDLPADDFTVPIGKAAVRREGRDLTIVSYAAMVHTSLEAAAELAREGIEAEVIDLRTLLPLDRETILALGAEDEQAARRARRHAHRRHRRGNRGRGHGRRLRGPRRPGPPRHFARHAGAVRAGARGVFPSQRWKSCRRGSGTGTLLKRVVRVPWLVTRGEPGADKRELARITEHESRVTKEVCPWPSTSSCPRWGKAFSKAPSRGGSRSRAIASSAMSRCSKSRPTRWTRRFRRLRPAS